MKCMKAVIPQHTVRLFDDNFMFGDQTFLCFAVTILESAKIHRLSLIDELQPSLLRQNN